MVSTTRHRSAQVAVALLTSLIVAATLAGCGVTADRPASAVSPSASPSSSPGEPSSSASPSAPAGTPTPSASPDSGAIAVSVNCNTLVSAQTIYDFNPNFTLSPGAAPAAGSAGARAVAAHGESCSWVNNTNKDNLVVSAAKPGPAALAALKSAASSGTAVTGLGDSAYFTTAGHVGRLDVFSGAAWVTATSTYFSVAMDAAPLATSALAAIK